MIPDEAVEAAAVAYQSIIEGTGQPCWDELPKQRQDNRLYWMRSALEAAAPYMAARALRDAVDAFPLETITAPDNAVVWLMRRAEHLGG